MRNFVIINGVNSNTINGLGINELPPITKPEMRNIREEIDGRDGDITTNLGYSAYDKTITIGLFGTGYDINNIVAFFNGEGTIVFSNEPDKYYNFKILNQIDYESLQKFRTASITFHCQPFKYPLSETPLEIEYDYIEDEGETLTLNNTGNALMELALKGNTSQSGTPTPTSPIPVSVVSGDNDVVVSTENKLPYYQSATYTNNGIDYTSVGDGTYKLNNTATNTSYWEMTLDEAYTIQASDYIQLNNDKAISNVQFVLRDTTNTQIGAFGCTSVNKIYSLSSYAGRTIGRIRCYVVNGTAINNLTIQPMICNSSTQIDFVIHQSQTYEVDLGTLELCKIGTYQDYFTKNSGKNLLPNEWTSGSISGSTGLPVLYSSRVYTTNKIKVKPNTTYTIHNHNTSSYSMNNLIDEYKLDGTYISRQTITNGGTFTTSANAEYINITLNNPSDTMTYALYQQYLSDGTLMPMLNEGSTALPYEPYGTGQWCKYNAIGKVVLDGTQELGFSGSYNAAVYIDSSIMNISQYVLGAMSNKLLGVKLQDFNSTADSITLNSAYTRMLFKITGIGSAADATTYLTSNPIIVYYVLATPYLSLIEDTNLIEQLDNLENAMSYTGTTNIGQVNNDKAFIISAKALEKGTNEVVVNNVGNVYSKPLLALEGNGNVDIYLDNTQILRANVEDKMNIDIAQLEAYNPDTMTLLNRQVIGNYNSMTLQPGNNTIRIDGALDKATITNYTRYL